MFVNGIVMMSVPRQPPALGFYLSVQRRIDCESFFRTTALTTPPQRRLAVMCAAVDLISGSPGTTYDLWAQFPVIETKLVFLLQNNVTLSFP